MANKPTSNYDPSKESYWQNFWYDTGVYRFDPDSSKPLFTIDTPPPTISGKLHLGHVFSYTQAETVARFFRATGHNVRYPFCLDDNGLPTERLVEKEKGILGRNTPLKEFIDLCNQLIVEFAPKYINLFKSLGFSYDFDLRYDTYSPEVQKMSQATFIDFLARNEIYEATSPALYCPECRTSVAQAEVEDKLLPSVFYDLKFTTDSGDTVVIATTRPELLPAIVAVFVNPDDPRHKDLIGKTLTTPLGDKVKVYADTKVLPEKGSGVVMCCSYGDEVDMAWVKEFNLGEKIIISLDGTIQNVTSVPELNGSNIPAARKIIVEHLKNQGSILGEKQFEHEVGVHERCGTPMEIIPINQWFVKILDHKQELLVAGEKIKWHPAFMKKRYLEWVKNLKWDWCISRGRYFGIPVPVFHCQDCDAYVLPDLNELPLDPRTDTKARTCHKCGSSKLTADRNVFDTWFTSGQTPDINNLHPKNGQLKGKMIPMSLRPHAHDIIRTWSTYTILMSLLKNKNIPWESLMISGHVLAKKGEKISKRTGGGAYDPTELVATHSADAIRYSMCGASLGVDGFFDEEEVKNGRKLVNKLWNAGKLVLSSLSDYQPHDLPESELKPIDQWLFTRLTSTQKEISAAFRIYEYSKARQLFEDFFWHDFCDNYLEIVKGRIFSDDASGKLSAQFTLFNVYFKILQLASPFVPHITEEMYHASVVMNAEDRPEILSEIGSGFYKNHFKNESLHSLLWENNFSSLTGDDTIYQGGNLLLQAISLVRQLKSDRKLSLGQPLPSLQVITKDSKTLDLLKPYQDDLKSVSRAQTIFLDTKENSSAEFSITL